MELRKQEDMILLLSRSPMPHLIDIIDEYCFSPQIFPKGIVLVVKIMNVAG